MKSKDNKRFIYERNQLIETICQLRFPTILTIDTKEPADFQETIRADFPRYSCQTEQVARPDGKPQQVRNHSFITEDGYFKLSLTKDFISLSTMHYSGWERFALMLHEPLAQFIRVYQPAYFDRIGLRYLNAFSREKLEVQDRHWNELIQPHCLGVLADDNVEEKDVVKCAIDVERKLDERCANKLHAGPGNIRRAMRTETGLKTVQEPETRFVLDIDVFTVTGIRTKLEAAAETLELLHDHADRIFSDAITDMMHAALEPVEI